MNKTFQILVAGKLGEAGLKRLEQAQNIQYDLKIGIKKAELLAIIPKYDGLIVRSSTQVDADIIRAGKRLKIIGRAGIGTDNIDIPAASMAGIIVMNTPGANSISIAEQSMTLMLAASRHTVAAHIALQAGQWQRSRFKGHELFGKTLGIIGFDQTGPLVAQRAQAFGMNVIVYDPIVSEDVGQEANVLLVDLDDLFAQSDYISLHTSLSETTKNIINADSIAQMKNGVIIINTARGKLIDENALVAGLQSGKVRAAALDVYRQEPPQADNLLLGLPNVVHTPHLGAATVEAQHQVALRIAEQVVFALRGTDFANSLNMPFHINTPFETIRPFMELSEKLGQLHAGLAAGRVKNLEVEVKGPIVEGFVRAIASAILKGLLKKSISGRLNYINAPVIAHQQGISISQTSGTNGLVYSNLITCRVTCDGGITRTLAGVLFGGQEPRVVQLDQYAIEAKPEGVVLIMHNQDVPGVIGQVGTILSAYQVNIGEWRLGRDKPGGRALSFINLDKEPSETVLNALAGITAVTQVKLVSL